MRRSWTSLKRRADFLRIAASGHRRVTPAFIVQAARSEHLEDQRIGFTVSRKVGNAVARNRAKRRLRALADTVVGAERTGFDLVLIGRGAALSREFTAMVADLRQALGQLQRPSRASARPDARS